MRGGTVLALVAWGVAAAASAKAPEDPGAERQRLEQEIVSLAQRNAWSGVERTFAALEALVEAPRPGAPAPPLSLRAYTLGSLAASSKGNTLAALDRLDDGLAHGLGDTADVLAARDQRDALVHRFGYVHVTVYTARIPPLEPTMALFAPDERASVAFAKSHLAKERSFMGLVPVGSYTLGDLAFTIAADAPMLEVRVGTPPVSGTVVEGQAPR